MFPPEVVFCQVAGGVGRLTIPSLLALKLPAAEVLFSKGWTGPLSTTSWTGPASTRNLVAAHSKPFFVFHGGCQTGFR